MEIANIIKKGESVDMSRNVSACPKVLSCQTCRKRRKKCDLNQPCSNCVKWGVTCIPVNVDRRKNRVETSYLESLEKHVAQLESSLANIKTAKNNEDKEKILQSISLDGVVFPATPEGNLPITTPKSFILSAFPEDSPVPCSSANSSTSLSSSMSQVSVDITDKGPNASLENYKKNLSRNPFILSSLSLFFKWLYPSHYFLVYREALLSAFFGDQDQKSYYCSEELVYAISALGSRISRKSDELYCKSTIYYGISKEIVLKKVFGTGPASRSKFETPSLKLALIQSLLCLSFYDLGRGENPSAWYLSGLAFRIAHEIGLHLSPATSNASNEEPLSEIDKEVRTRIYWGCYLTDHFMAVLFGKPSILRMSNSTVPETNDLPDIKAAFDHYMYYKPLLVAAPVKCLIFLSRMTELYAKRIFIQSKSNLQSIEALSSFNSQLQSWRSDLPKELAWTSETLEIGKECDPTKIYLWHHYYMVLISYNKVFLSDVEESRKMIEDSIQELFYLLKNWESKFYSFEKCSIQMVYTAVLAVQCIQTKQIRNIYYGEFIAFLGSPTLNYEFVHDILKNENSIGTPYTFNFGDDNNWLIDGNHDLSLLNEIDALIGDYI